LSTLFLVLLLGVLHRLHKGIILLRPLLVAVILCEKFGPGVHLGRQYIL
jgi:hypothetical protein